MVLCLALIAWGYRRGGFHVPALILCGLVGMRFVMWGLEDTVQPLAAFHLWLYVAMSLMYKSAWVSGALCLLSGVTYPTLLAVGVRIEYLGLTPIIADAFLLAAIFTGWLGMVERFNSSDNRARMADNRPGFAVGMAAHKMRDTQANRGGA